MALEKKYIVALWSINILFLAMMLIASLTNDANGRFLGMNDAWSRIAFIGIIATGLPLDMLLGLLDRNGRRRAIVVGIMSIYVVLTIPAFI